MGHGVSINIEARNKRLPKDCLVHYIDSDHMVIKLVLKDLIRTLPLSLDVCKRQYNIHSE